MATRVRQRLRTRRALLDAAHALLAEGRTPTVAEVAERALVSRATAYRYFPTQDALLQEVPLDVDWESVVADLWRNGPPSDAADAVAEVRAAFHDFAVRNERQYRLFFRNWLDRWLRRDEGDEPERRGARREPLVARGLEPCRSRLDDETFDRLTIALSVMIGFESVIVLNDVLGLDRDRAEAAMDWAVRTLVEAAASQGD